MGVESRFNIHGLKSRLRSCGQGGDIETIKAMRIRLAPAKAITQMDKLFLQRLRLLKVRASGGFTFMKMK
jgi:hypothetical protein